MAIFQIRKYEDDDAEAVREIITLGMTEHVPVSFMQPLKQPLTQMVLMCIFCTLMATSKSFLLPILAVTLLLAGTRQLHIYVTNGQIDACLRDDIGNVTETFLKKTHSCFWVAECEGRMVASVGCQPDDNASGCLKMKHMVVRRSHRGMGIAKALCRTVADFSRDRGFAGVTLCTSVVQTDAQRLYEHMGYKKIREVDGPWLLCKIFNLTTSEYRLDLLRTE